jgi:hypothetical protein
MKAQEHKWSLAVEVLLWATQVLPALTDVQAHSDPFFHAYSIQQVTNYVKQLRVKPIPQPAIPHQPPMQGRLHHTERHCVYAYGTGSDANGDAITYDWNK